MEPLPYPPQLKTAEGIVRLTTLDPDVVLEYEPQFQHHEVQDEELSGQQRKESLW